MDKLKDNIQKAKANSDKIVEIEEKKLDQLQEISLAISEVGIMLMEVNKTLKEGFKLKRIIKHEVPYKDFTKD